MTNDELNRLVTELIRGPWPAERCPVCGWPLARDLAAGCILRSCAQRPAPAVRADAVVDYCGARWGDLYLWLAAQNRTPRLHARIGGGYWVTVWDGPNVCYGAIDNTPGRTLCKATLRAYNLPPASDNVEVAR